MNELRQEFEKTETAKFWTHTTVYFDDEKDGYVSSKIECSHYAQIINAAFMMFQEQHKKIVAYQKMLEMQKAFDEANGIVDSIGMRWGGYFEPMKYEVAGVVAEKELHHGEYLIDKSTLDKPQQSIIVTLDDDKIKEIFMVNSNELHNNR